MATQNESLTAEALIQQLKTLREQIPDYTQLTTEEKEAIRRLSYTDPQFVRASLQVLGNSDGVQKLLGKGLDEVRKEIDDDGRWTEAENEVRAILKGLIAANLIRRHRLALTAHQTYQIGRQLIRTKGEANLIPHVNGMQQLARASRRRAKAAPAPEVTVTPKTP